jgi:hypothetical protein
MLGNRLTESMGVREGENLLFQYIKGEWIFVDRFWKTRFLFAPPNSPRPQLLPSQIRTTTSIETIVRRK